MTRIVVLYVYCQIYGLSFFSFIISVVVVYYVLLMPIPDSTKQSRYLPLP